MNRADWQTRQTGDLLGSQSARRFTEKVQQPQSALQRGDVIGTFWASRRHVSGNYKNESPDYLMKVVFVQPNFWARAGQTFSLLRRSISSVQ